MKYKLVKAIADIFIPFFVDLEVINRPKFPISTGALVAANHIHALDPVFISYALYPTWIHHIAKYEIFKVPILPLLLKWLGVIPVNRERPGANTIKKALKLLSQGKIVCIFPQGTRKKADFGKIKKGVARLALAGKVAIYPVAITGLEKIRLLGLFKRPKVKVIFGKPIETKNRINTKEEIESLTTELEEIMKNLYHKIYFLGN